MRLFIVGDLHYGMVESADEAIRNMAAYIAQEATKDDVLLVPGDIAVDDAGIIECLGHFANVKARKMAIPGNHDVYRYDDRDSFARYVGLQCLFTDAGFISLEKKSQVIGDIGFVGTMGWYDYSFRDDIGIPIDAYIQKTLPDHGLMWTDKKYVQWKYSDEEMVRMSCAWLKSQLEIMMQQTQVKRVVALTHHIPIKKLLFHPRWLLSKKWRFANAFLGSSRFGELFAQYREKLRFIISGHIHRHKVVRQNDQTYMSIGGSYDRKQLVITDSLGDKVQKIYFG